MEDNEQNGRQSLKRSRVSKGLITKEYFSDCRTNDDEDDNGDDDETTRVV